MTRRRQPSLLLSLLLLGLLVGLIGAGAVGHRRLDHLAATDTDIDTASPGHHRHHLRSRRTQELQAYAASRGFMAQEVANPRAFLGGLAF